jgi:DNA-binding MarR family transcriptional regulator
MRRPQCRGAPVAGPPASARRGAGPLPADDRNLLQHYSGPRIHRAMGEVLRRRLMQARFDSPHHEAVLSLLVAAARVYERLDGVYTQHGITRSQYNVLRILRGAHPGGYPRCDIARRLIERAPDVTRLIDRLEHEGLVERRGSVDDRRLSITRITGKGLRLLEHMHSDVEAAESALAKRLSADEAEDLSRICERLYDPGNE